MSVCQFFFLFPIKGGGRGGGEEASFALLHLGGDLWLKSQLVVVPRGVALERAVGMEMPAFLWTISFTIFSFLFLSDLLIVIRDYLFVVVVVIV